MSDLGPEQFKPPRIIELRDTHAMVSELRAEFSNDPELHALQLAMLAGTCARSCRIAYTTRSRPSWAFGPDSQIDYKYFLHEVLHANKPEGDWNWLQLRTAMHSLKPELSAAHFDQQLAETIALQSKFMHSPRDTAMTDILRLRETAHTMRTASELLFADAVQCSNDAIILPSNDMHRRVVYEFTDEFYWQSGGGFSFLPERDRTDRIHVAFFMKDLHRRHATTA